MPLTFKVDQYSNFKYKINEQSQQIRKEALRSHCVKRNCFIWVMLSTLLRHCHIFEY